MAANTKLISSTHHHSIRMGVSLPALVIKRKRKSQEDSDVR